jgi:hypothetical protein
MSMLNIIICGTAYWEFSKSDSIFTRAYTNDTLKTVKEKLEII